MATTYDLTNPLKPTILKDPLSKLDYSLDWSAWLADVTDTIASVLVTPEAPLVLASVPTFVSGVVRFFISGGDLGATRQVDCQITTVGGRIDERSIYLKIRER